MGSDVGTDLAVVAHGDVRTWVLASANPHKADEIRAILAAAVPDLRLVPRPADVPDVEEVADTLLGNARLKARALCAATGVAAVADDTGLEVDALGGAPGVRTARYAGEAADAEANVAKLLGALAEVGAHDATTRGARFRTVAIVVFPDGAEVWAEGSVPGTIASARRGIGGFGYDPVFVPAQPRGTVPRTFAEMASEEKHALSHRGRAFRALARLLTS